MASTTVRFDTVCLKACPTCLPSSRSAILSRSDYYVGSVDTRWASVGLGTLTSHRMYPGFAGPFTFVRRRSHLPKCPLYPAVQPGYRERNRKAWCRLRASRQKGGHLLDRNDVSFSTRADLPRRPGRRHVESLFDSSINLPLTGQGFAEGFNL